MKDTTSVEYEVSSQDIRNRSGLVLGRELDFHYLDSRIKHSGVTFIRGTARCGKTWLVTEWARQKMESDSLAVGIHKGGPIHALLYAIQDLWRRWFYSGPFVQQAKATIAYLQKKNNLSRISSFGIMVEELVSILGKAPEIAANLLFSGAGLMKFLGMASGSLSRVHGDVSTARTYIQPATYLQVLGLLDIITQASGRQQSLVLVVDAWEYSEHKTEEEIILRGLLDRFDESPVLHVVIVYRKASDERSSKAEIIARSIVRDYSNCLMCDVSSLTLNAEEENILFAKLRKCSPALSELDDSAISLIINSYAGAIDAIIREEPTTTEELEKTRDNILQRKFGDIERILDSISAQLIRPAAAALLIPQLMDRADWLLVSKAFVEVLDEKQFDQLRSVHVLSNKEPDVPDWEHEERQQTAVNWYLNNARGTLVEVFESVLTRVAALTLPSDESFFPATKILFFARKISEKINIDPAIKDLTLLPLCFAGLNYQKFESIYEQTTIFSNKDHLERLIRRNPNLGTVLCAAVINLNLIMSIRSGFSLQYGLQLARSLYEYNPTDSSTCNLFALALHNECNELIRGGKASYAKTSLEQLWILNCEHEHSVGSQVMTIIASAIFDYLVAIGNEAPEFQEWFSRLETVQLSNPEDSDTALYFIKALCNRHCYFLRIKTIDAAEELLAAIRIIQAQFPEHLEIKHSLALALYNTIIDRDSLVKHSAFLNELSVMAKNDSKIAGCYLKAISFIIINIAKTEELKESTGYLQVLHSLFEYMHNSLEDAREWAKAIAFVMWFAREEQRSLWKELVVFIDLLSNCLNLYPSDDTIRRCFLISMISCMYKAYVMGIEFKADKYYSLLFGIYSIDTVSLLASVLSIMSSVNDKNLSMKALYDLQSLGIEYPLPYTGIAAVYSTLIVFMKTLKQGDITEAANHVKWLSDHSGCAVPEDTTGFIHIFREQSELLCRVPNVFIQSSSLNLAAHLVTTYFNEANEQLLKEIKMFLMQLEITADKLDPSHFKFANAQIRLIS